MHINIHEILVGSTSNGFQWSTFLTSIFGVVVGGLITLYTSMRTTQKNYENNFELLKKQEEMETKATIKAIIAELQALKQIFYVEFIPKILNSKEKYLNYSYPLGTDYFTVFNANTPKIGKITNDELRECIINLYITAKFFLDCIATNNSALKFYENCSDKVNISTQSTTLLDMLNSSSSTGKSKSAADSYIDVLIQNNNLRYQQKMKEVLGYDTSSSSKDAQYEKVASSASNLNSVISSLSNESLWNEDSSDYSKDKVYDTVNNFVSAYNTLITNINTVGSTIENTNKTKLDKLVTDNKEALAAVGITVDDNGKLSVDTDKLKSADMSELKKMLGSESELMKGIKEQSGSVNNIVSEALSIQKSLSGLYNSSSSSVDVSDLLYGTSYDSKGLYKVNIFEVSVGNRAA